MFICAHVGAWKKANAAEKYGKKVVGFLTPTSLSVFQKFLASSASSNRQSVPGYFQRVAERTMGMKGGGSTVVRNLALKRHNCQSMDSFSFGAVLSCSRGGVCRGTKPSRRPNQHVLPSSEVQEWSRN